MKFKLRRWMRQLPLFDDRTDAPVAVVEAFQDARTVWA